MVMVASAWKKVSAQKLLDAHFIQSNSFSAMLLGFITGSAATFATLFMSVPGMILHLGYCWREDLLDFLGKLP